MVKRVVNEGTLAISKCVALNRKNGRPKQQGWKGQAQSKRAYNVEDLSGTSEPEERQHVFHVGTGSSDGIVDLKVGGVDLKSVLIDSGASCNLMDKATWEELKA